MGFYVCVEDVWRGVGGGGRLLTQINTRGWREIHRAVGLITYSHSHTQHQSINSFVFSIYYIFSQPIDRFQFLIPFPILIERLPFHFLLNLFPKVSIKYPSKFANNVQKISLMHTRSKGSGYRRYTVFRSHTRLSHVVFTRYMHSHTKFRFGCVHIRFLSVFLSLTYAFIKGCSPLIKETQCTSPVFLPLSFY